MTRREFIRLGGLVALAPIVPFPVPAPKPTVITGGCRYGKTAYSLEERREMGKKLGMALRETIEMDMAYIHNLGYR